VILVTLLVLGPTMVVGSQLVEHKRQLSRLLDFARGPSRIEPSIVGDEQSSLPASAAHHKTQPQLIVVTPVAEHAATLE
jgi:hypothetical protein